MALDRSWLRRGLMSPPPWGESVPDLWAESEVRFGRAIQRKDEYGGFLGNALNATYLTVAMHVQMDRTEPAGPYTLTSGVLQRRLLRMAGKLPDAILADPTLLPTKGDIVTWVHPVTGEELSLPVRQVFVAEAGDHMEIETEWFS